MLAMAACVIGGVLAADAAFAAADCQWTGAGGNPQWSTAANWTCGHAPLNGDLVTFRGGMAATAVSHNDMTNLVLLGITMRDAAGSVPGQFGDRGAHWDISGNRVTLTTLLSVTIGVDRLGQLPSLRVPLVLGGNAAIVALASTDAFTSVPWPTPSINLNGFSLTVSLGAPIELSGVSGAGGLIKEGATTLVMGSNSYSGVTQINEGSVVLEANTAFGATGPANGTTAKPGTALVLTQNITCDEAITISGDGPLQSGALRTIEGVSATFTGPLTLPAATRIMVETNSRINLNGPVAGAPGQLITKVGDGTLGIGSTGSAWDSLMLLAGVITVDAPTVVSGVGTIMFGIPDSTFDLHNMNVTVGGLQTVGVFRSHIVLGSGTLTVNPVQDELTNFRGPITGSGGVVKAGPGDWVLVGTESSSYTGPTTVQAGVLALVMTGGATAITGSTLTVNGGALVEDGVAQTCDHDLCPVDEIADTVRVAINAPGTWKLEHGAVETIGALTGTGIITGVPGNQLLIGANNVSSTFAGALDIDSVVKVGTGTLTLTGSTTEAHTTAVRAGTLLVNGALSGDVDLFGGTIGGTGTIAQDMVSSTGGTISPGAGGPGILHARNLTLSQSTDAIAIELNGTTAGTGYDQIVLAGDLTLAGNPKLQATRGYGPPKGTQFTIIMLPPGRKATGTFSGLAEGATLTINQQRFSITYRGGNGNDVVLTATSDPPAAPKAALTYYLSEGATGGFFDEDVLIANPNDTDAPVTLLFSKEDGQQVLATRTVPAKARLTVRVAQIPGLAATSASAQITSDAQLPLVVERSMFWDASYYAGDTGSAADQPGPDWFFAEGSQGFFNTFVLVTNPNATPADVTVTFLRENETPVVKTLTVGPTSRYTLHTGDVPELIDRSFGITVHATQPIVAERSMYFGATPTRALSGGTESAGVTAPSSHWFLAEGATGTFFDTFVVLSNPQSTDAHVQLQYLLDSGETVTVSKTIAANARLTTNIKAEADPRLQNAALSTVVTSDQPIIAERSMYWPGAAKPWGEGHNSFGVVDAGTRWGLSEGRTGGPHNFHTYILLANPQTTTAEVTVSYLRESGAPLVKTYSVSPTTRFNIDTDDVTELHDESFGAIVEVTNGVPIIVERSMYWDAGGIQFSGGTNATGIRLQDATPTSGASVACPGSRCP
jgi:autotransporter-associated beta strand protein